MKLGEEGPKKPGKRVGEEETLEEGEGDATGGGGGGGGVEADSGNGGSTKKEEKRLPGSPLDPPTAGHTLAPAPTSVQPAHSHDQHHFLRSSVRPQSKRLRKDSQASCSAGGGGSGCSGAKGKGTVFARPPPPPRIDALACTHTYVHARGAER